MSESRYTCLIKIYLTMCKKSRSVDLFVLICIVICTYFTDIFFLSNCKFKNYFIIVLYKKWRQILVGNQIALFGLCTMQTLTLKLTVIKVKRLQP